MRTMCSAMALGTKAAALVRLARSQQQPGEPEVMKRRALARGANGFDTLDDLKVFQARCQLKSAGEPVTNWMNG
jgi:hypothetical protein